MEIGTGATELLKRTHGGGELDARSALGRQQAVIPPRMCGFRPLSIQPGPSSDWHGRSWNASARLSPTEITPHAVQHTQNVTISD